MLCSISSPMFWYSESLLNWEVSALWWLSLFGRSQQCWKYTNEFAVNVLMICLLNKNCDKNLSDWMFELRVDNTWHLSPNTACLLWSSHRMIQKCYFLCHTSDVIKLYTCIWNTPEYNIPLKCITYCKFALLSSCDTVNMGTSSSWPLMCWGSLVPYGSLE